MRKTPHPATAVLLLLPLAALASAAEVPQYNRDIRPILSDKCFACHGFDAKHREADLRLDERAAAIAKDDKGNAAIVPGDAAASGAWQRILATDPDDIMPPPESHKQLSAEEKDTIKRWIDGGAVYQKHWAFEAPAPPAAPEAGIDALLSARLSKEHLTATPEADRPTLIRRVSFALTGLPPAPEETDRFVQDTAPDAYEQMVDRYLASPRYGEEMARYWLDVARYADTHGLHLDNERQMWAYRDWVVRAFNNNLPFDQFTIEQLAGDLLPNPTQDQLIATGFNRCNVTTSEGGAIPEEWTFRYAVDRASTTAQTWLGLTAACAVCHDHKYDPITQKEFYSFYAFFHSNADPAMDGNAILTNPVMKVKPADYDAKMKDFAERSATVQKALDEKAAAVVYADPAELSPRPAAVESEQVWFEDSFPEGAALLSSGTPLAYVDSPVLSGTKSLKVSGPDTAQHHYSSGVAPFTVPAEPVVFVNVFLDPSDPPEEIMIQFNDGAWEHRAFWGEDKIEFGAKGTPGRFAAGPLPEAGKWARLEVPAASLGLTAGQPVVGYALTLHGGTAYFDLMGMKGREDPAADPARSFLAWRQAMAGKDTPGVPGRLKAWLKAGTAEPRTSDELAKLRGYYLGNVCASTKETFAADSAALAAVKAERDAYDATVPSTFIWNDLAKPRDSFVMTRGEYNQPGEKVEPGTPAVLPALQPADPAGRANRLDLARWLVAKENPLTSRVTVNRFWQQIFGTGLVKSSHDFGTQGDLPSNAALMDWLSVWFQENGWDVKKLTRLMLVSHAFRQTADAPPALWELDPENRLLARGPRFRLDAEQLRDQALFAGGLLNLEIGGRGIRPYQPPNVWEPVGYIDSNTRNYKADTGAGLYRRSLYAFLKRTAPPPFMTNFDAPSREQTCAKRERSNTPLQALQLLNDVQHFEAARGLAVRVLAIPADKPARLAAAWKIVLAREPSADEAAAVGEFFDRSLAKYTAAPAEAEKAITFGDSPPPPDANKPELAAWTLTANLILNLDEAVNRN